MRQDATGVANPLVPILSSSLTTKSIFDNIRYVKVNFLFVKHLHTVFTHLFSV